MIDEVDTATEVVAVVVVLDMVPLGEDEYVEGRGEATTVETAVVGGMGEAAPEAVVEEEALNILMGVDCIRSICRAALAEESEEADCWRRFWLLIIWADFCEKEASEERVVEEGPEEGRGD